MNTPTDLGDIILKKFEITNDKLYKKLIKRYIKDLSKGEDNFSYYFYLYLLEENKKNGDDCK